MFHTLHGLLREDDVVLADRYFSGWFDIVLPRQHGAHVVWFASINLAPPIFVRVNGWERDDHLVQWNKP